MPQSKWILQKVGYDGIIHLDEGLTTIGRNVNSTIVPASDYVSRNHAQILISPNSEIIKIIDLGSRNGIYVNEYQYCNVECVLNAGDRIGIGVTVEDSVVTSNPEGKYPVYILRKLPQEKNNEISREEPPAKVVVPPKASPPKEINQNLEKSKEVPTDFVVPKSSSIANAPVSIKIEPEPEVSVCSANKIRENIETIFGELNSDILSTLSEETRKIVEYSTRTGKPVLSNDIICISSSEDEENDSSKTNKQVKPSNGYLNIDEDKNDAEEIQQPDDTTPRDSIKILQNQLIQPPQKQQTPKEPDKTHKSNQIITNEPEIIQIPIKDEIKDELDDDDDDLFFTQKIFEDMKEYENDFPNDEDNGLKDEPEDSDTTIKQEYFSQNLDGTMIDLDDDELDEDFTKTSKLWVKLAKNCLSNTFNASQVYEDPYSDEEQEPNQSAKSNSIFVIDDSDDELDFVDRARLVEANVKSEKSEPSSSSDENIKPLMRVLSSSEDEKEETNNNEPSTSGYSEKCHKKISRRLSTAEEVPNKKPRITKNSDDDNNDHNIIRDRRSSASSHKTYSRKKRKHSHTSPPKDDPSTSRDDDVFDKLKQHDKSKHQRKTSSSSSPTSKTQKHSSERKKSNDKSSHKDQTKSTIYKSATIARLKSIDRQPSIEANFAECIVEVKKYKPESTTKIVEEETKAPKPPIVPVATTSKVIRGPPEIINPPNLPIHKGKLRGISAAQNRIAEALKHSADKNDLRRKWLEKPSAKKDKEKSKAIQETRKQKLKELSDKKQAESVAAKKKHSRSSNGITSAEEKEASRKTLKVKVTQNNRGTFLLQDPIPSSSTKPTHYTIPKKTSNSSNTSKSPPKKTCSSTKKPSEPAKPHSAEVTTFGMELAQADVVLNQKNSRERLKSTDNAKQRAPPRPTNKKVNFASCSAYHEETSRVLQQVNKSCLTSPISNNKKQTKKVTFNLNPEIHYIESIFSAKPKRFQKESSTFMERRMHIRHRYPILDKTDALLDDILSWSQLWLQNKQHVVNMMTFPMSNQFKTFDEYKNIVMPLLKMEYLGFLEQSMENKSSKSVIVATLETCAPHNHRDVLFVQYNSALRPSELSFNDLALLDITLGSVMRSCFGYVSNIRRTGTSTSISIEIPSNIISKDIVKSKPQIKIRRIIDGIRMHLGTFNAVHQLEHTPLIEKILNPMELINNENHVQVSNIEYKGFNELNHEQREILLKTYEKSIYQSNPNVSLINGPPGTGKSVLISNLAIQLLYGNEVNELDKKILICAQSNMAVDVIAEKLIKIKLKLSPDTAQFNAVRYGVEEKVHPNVRGITMKAILQRHRMNILKKQASQMYEQTANEENLARDILQLEAKIIEMERQNFRDVRQEELSEMRKSLALKKNILNQMFRPEDEKRLTKMFLENANIVCSTLSGCIKLASYVDYFDVCIIDEATQCTEPWTLMPLKFGVSNLIMVGDTQQLPATVLSQSAKELGLEISLFTRIQKCLESNTYRSNIKKNIDIPIYTLHEQYRMHSEISKWPNMYFYKNQLRNNPKTDEFKSSIKPFSILNLEYKQNDALYGQTSGQISNNLEAEFVAKLVMTLDNYIPNKFYSYGVITPYAHHRVKLETMIRSNGLKNIMVNTIDSYQGIEKDVIIISNARTHGVGFLGNYQRLNVALTRPRKCLILCGNFKNLESVPSWASLLANAKERGLYHNISAHEASDITKNVIEKIKIKRQS